MISIANLQKNISLGFLLAFSFITSSLYTYSAFAAGTTTFGINSIYATDGAPFSVSINLSNAVPVSSIQFNVEYDASVLTLASAALGTATAPWYLFANISQPGLAKIGLFNVTVLPLLDNQQVLVLNFTVKDTGVDGKKTSPLTINNVSLEGLALPPAQIYSGVYNKTTINRAPVFDSVTGSTVTAGNNLTFNVSATDPDGDVLTYSASHLPAGASFNTAMRVFSWTPTIAQVPGDYVFFTVSDGSLQDQKSVNIVVNPPLEVLYSLEINSFAGSVQKTVNGVPTTATSFAAGTVVQLSVVPNSGYAFTNWTGSATGSANPLMVTMNAEKTVTANFTALAGYSLTVNAVNGSVISKVAGVVTTAVSFAPGTLVELTPVPELGYGFSSWSGNVTGSVASVTIMMNANKAVTANFVKKTYGLMLGTSHGLFVKRVNGVVTTAFVFPAGTVVEITAVPDNGYAFSGWTGDTTGQANPIAVTMNRNLFGQANFTKLGMCSLYVNAVNSSVVKKAGGLATNASSFPIGTVVVLTALPNSGYTFSGWTGDVTGLANPVTITMNTSKTVTANVSQDVKTLTVNAVNGSVIKKVGGAVTTAASFATGTVVELTAVPNSGYGFAGWTGDVTGAVNPVSVTLNANTTVSAGFNAVVPQMYTLSFTYAPPGSVVVRKMDGTITTAASFPAGTQLSLTALPVSGMQFQSWGFNGISSSNPYTITMLANMNLAVNYIPVVPGDFSLTVIAVNGSVTRKVAGVVTAASNFTAGTLVELTPVPEAGYAFTGWTGDVTGSTYPVTVVMALNRKVTANFVKRSYGLMLGVNHGSFLKKVNGVPTTALTFPAGTVVEITAVPDINYAFSSWTGGITGTANPVLVTLNANVFAQANFNSIKATTTTTN